MKTKNILYLMISLYCINSYQSFYAKDAQDEDTHTIIPLQTTESKSNSEHDKTIFQFIEDNFQSVIEQTQKIEYTLQQIELILNGNQIKFNSQKITKAELLSEIKEIKSIIQTIFEFYTKQIEKDEAIILGTCFNKAFIDYLLPIVQNDVTKLNCQNFDKLVTKDFEKIKNSLESLDQIVRIIDNNENKLRLLAQASDDIGLNTLNKAYRYLNTKTLPIYGKTTIDAIQDVAFWGGLGALAYATAIYTIPNGLEIERFGFKFNTDSLWFKKTIGNIYEANEFNSPTTEEKRRKELSKDFGLGYMGTIDSIVRSNTNYTITTILGFLTYQTKSHFEQLYKNGTKQFNDFLNYYIKGDNSLGKNCKVQKTYFKDMIGGADLEKLAYELADYLKNPTRYDRAGIAPSTGYLLVGPSQTGKSFFAKALKTLIDEKFSDNEDAVKFFNITAEDVECFGFARIFNIVRRNSPCIVFIDELDMHGARRDRHAKNTQELLTSMNGIETDPDKKVIIIAATNKPEELDFALKQKGRLGMIITFDYPTYECRKAYLEKQLLKKNVSLSDDMIDIIAQETDGQTYNMIEDIIKQALQLATYETRPVTESDFEITLDREIRKIKTNTIISPEEKELVAIYQAGQAATRHLLNTNQQIVKITIDAVDKIIKSKEGFAFSNESKSQQHENLELISTQRTKPTRLGFVFTMSKLNNHELLSDADQEKELMALLAGQAALEILKGTTYHQFGKEDRAKILDILEKKISQGTPITNEMITQALMTKEDLYQKVKTLLKNHTQFIKTITDELLKVTTINKKQWEQLATNYPVQTV